MKLSGQPKLQQRFTDFLVELHARALADASAAVGREVQHLFTLGGEPLVGVDMGDEHGVFPMFLWQADVLHKHANGIPFGFGVREEPNSITHYAVLADMTTEAASEVILYLTEAFFDARNSLPKSLDHHDAVDLEPWYHGFQSDMRKRLAVTKPAQSTSPSLN